MRNGIKKVLFLAILFMNSASMAANDKLFCCEDSNYQQKMLHDFDTGHGTSFNAPPGAYLKKCTGVEYDLNNMSAYCEDKTGRTSFFRSYMHVGNCQHVYRNGDGFLKCGDDS